MLPQFSDKTMVGKITNVDHCGKFFFQPQGHKDDPDVLLCIQNSLIKEAFSCCSSPVYNELVIVLHEDYYYRAKVVAVNSGNADCYFFDFGCTKSTPFDSIFQVSKEILDEYFHLPERGFQCKLSHIEPSFYKCPNGKWTKSAIEFFREAVMNRECVIEVYSVVNDVASVELKIDGKSINKMLIQNEFATKCDEPYVSRVNHAERETYQLTEYHWVDRATEFKEKENSMVLTFIPSPPEEMCINTLNLKGPYTPLECRVTGTTFNSNVKIDQTSVNSACLNMCPENHEGQLLIAADIVGNTLSETTLHNVTAMPNIHGLAPLLAMIFAPTVIFECDTDFKRICELRSSLGFYNVSESFFPKHECTLPVNVKFNNEDFKAINMLRFNMSNLLMKMTKSDDTNDDDKSEMINSTKKLLLKLFQRNRKLLKPVPENMKKITADKKLGQVTLKRYDPVFVFNQIEFPKFRK